jgi:Zn-finger nucleic acid-binding protein
MGRSAVSNQHMTNKYLECPRDHSRLQETHVGEAQLDVCPKCTGQFFDSGEMFASFGMKADPSYWDRSETASAVRESEIHCPRCEKTMLLQDVSYEGTKVEIDRCRGCAGIWLDKGEVEALIKIGDKLEPLVNAEVEKAKADLAKMGTPDFSGGMIARFVKMFKKG